MTLTCVAYTASALPSGRIQLVLDDGQRGAAEERLFIADLAKLLKFSAKTLYRLSTRKKNPLPLTRGKGRPFITLTKLNAWLESDNRFPFGIGNTNGLRAMLKP